MYIVIYEKLIKWLLTLIYITDIFLLIVLNLSFLKENLPHYPSEITMRFLIVFVSNLFL